MGERLKPGASKASVPKGTAGSNPALSASLCFEALFAGRDGSRNLARFSLKGYRASY